MTKNSPLIPILSSFAGTRVLCVGDLILDCYISGEVDRISPEAPVPVLRIGNEKEMLGGVGNVARNLAGLGGSPSLVALIGNDRAGDAVKDQIAMLGNAEEFLVVEDGRPTAIKTRYLAGNQQILRADRELIGQVPLETGDEIISGAKAEIKNHCALVLSDYGKGVLQAGRAGELIQAAKDVGVPVIVDPKGADYGIYAGADLVTPNRKELAEATSMVVNSVGAATEAATVLMRQHGFGAVLVTMSGDGMVMVTDHTSQHVPANAREVFDVSGAGDTVVATLAGALAAGASLADAVRLANVAAGIVVGKVGTAAVYMTEVVAALHHQEIFRAEVKVMTRDESRDRADIWRRQNLKVGFTNGCFDLLHPGHVSLLAQARAVCDRLVVGVNSDASVTRLKGEGRPVQTEVGRATVLASLSSVDLVVIFAEDTPLELIETLRPDVLIKGADYTKADVVGAEEVEGWGGRVHLADLEPGHSTTATIQYLSGDGSDPS